MKQVRPETGPMEFENDWRGLFIRGDNAAYYVMHLHQLLKDIKDGKTPNQFDAMVCEDLLATLGEFHQFNEEPVVQCMKKFEDCIK